MNKIDIKTYTYAQGSVVPKMGRNVPSGKKMPKRSVPMVEILQKYYKNIKIQ